MKDLESGFLEVEKRVQTLIADNHHLRKRIGELEQEVAQARRDTQDFRNFQGKQHDLRERIERVLRSLEAIGRNGG